MSLRLIQLNKKKSQTYDLNTEEINFGISKEHFISDNRAIVSANSKYRGEFIFKLMKYDSNGHWYVFEDELLTIYDPTRPSPLSSCFIDLKRIREGE